jgi:hypothetical protein
MIRRHTAPSPMRFLRHPDFPAFAFFTTITAVLVAAHGS